MLEPILLFLSAVVWLVQMMVKKNKPAVMVALWIWIIEECFPIGVMTLVFFIVFLF